MKLKEKLKASTCDVCQEAFYEIIRLEAEVMSMERMAKRLQRPGARASDVLRSKTVSKIAKSAAAKALSQPRAHNGDRL